MALLNQISGSIRVAPAELSTDEVRIGRDPQHNDLVLPDHAVSRQHARLVRKGGRWVLEDRESRNRTLVNGAAVQACDLGDGDRIQIGSVVFVFRTGEAVEGDRLRVMPLRESQAEGSGPQTLARTQVGFIDPQSKELLGSGQDGRILAALYSIGKEINSEIENTEELLERVLSTAIREVGAEQGAVALKDLDTGELEVATPEIALDRSGTLLSDLVLPRAIADEVFRSHRSILTKDALHDEGFASSQSIHDARILSAMCVPLLFRKEALGILYVDNCAEAASFGQRQLEFLTCIADLAGIAVGNAGLYRRLREEMTDLKGRVDREMRLVGESEAFRQVLEHLRLVAPTEMTVLITGESGTGKELVARAVHRASPRADGPFIPVNCAAIPDTLIESELFGYAANSGIAGASPSGKPGKFELADKGTIFLDEIGDMKHDVQATILRVLQDRIVERLGGTKPISVDVRILAATNKNLEEAIVQGQFRSDLLFRLNRFHIHVPPLRERPDDIDPLVEHFLERFCGRRKRRARLSAQALRLLKDYAWPGNVRELEGVIERALLFGGGTIRPEDLPEGLRESGKKRAAGFKTLREVEEEHIRRVLEAMGGVVSHAAEVLGIARKTLHEKIKTFGIEER